MTAPNTLADIITKVRRLSGRPSVDQISDETITQYINTYYLYDMPETLRLLKLKDTLTFTTVPNVEVYPVDQLFPTLGTTAYITVEPPAYVAGQQVQYFQDLDLFYREWPKNNYIEQINTGDGTAGPFSGTLTATPVMSSVNPVGSESVTAPIGQDIRILFSANIGNQIATSAYDNGQGDWIDAYTGETLVGDIDYITGDYTITFSSAVPDGNPINASYIPYVASLPRCICFYQNQFFMRPVPDKAYIVEINAFRYPMSFNFDDETTSPELQFWWQLLAYGAALKILVDNGDYDNAERLRPYFNEQLLIVQRRTVKQQTNQRTQTIYSQDGASYGFSNLYPYI
jgi:hypothetical protein